MFQFFLQPFKGFEYSWLESVNIQLTGLCSVNHILAYVAKHSVQNVAEDLLNCRPIHLIRAILDQIGKSASSTNNRGRNWMDLKVSQEVYCASDHHQFS